jgi:hypothetical protein
MSALERHYSISEIAELWALSPGAVRSIFKDRGDVIRIGHGEQRYRRCYVTIRVPESVVQKVHAELRAKNRE